MSSSPAFQREQMAQLNNAGVSALAAGDAVTALRHLKSAFFVARNMAQTKEMTSLTKGSVCPFVEEAPGLKDPYFFVFNHALLLDVSAHIDLTLAKACLFFNLALVLHQHVQTTNCNDSSKTIKTLRAYDLAAQHFFKSNPSTAPLAMAALNNQAQIYFNAKDYARSQERLSCVQECAEFVTSEFATSDLHLVGAKDLHEIFLNVAIVTPPTMAPSA